MKKITFILLTSTAITCTLLAKNSCSNEITHHYKNYNIVDKEITDKNNFTERTVSIFSNKTPDKPVWVITPNQMLPDDDECNIRSIDLCDAMNNEWYHGGCFMSCMTYGPEFITFDEKSKKLYLAVGTTQIGTGGGTYFTFSADLNKKEIKSLGPIFGPAEGMLSPSGTHLLYVNEFFVNQNDMQIYNIKTNKFSQFTIKKHFFVNTTWINDNQISYQLGTRKDKFDKAKISDKKYIYTVEK